MTSKVFNELGEWFESALPQYEERGFALTIRWGSIQHDPQSAFVDIENAAIAGHVSVWSDGQCHLDAIDLASNELLIDAKYIQDIDAVGMDNALEIILRSERTS